MDIAQITARLIAALASLVIDAVRAYVEGDPSKLQKVQDVLDVNDRLRTEETLALERERTRAELTRSSGGQP